jgi:UDP-N-acetyl-D-mannosaminuronate dehydrogenase
MKVVVIGQGYVGLPLALAAARSGYAVTGIDTNLEKIQALAKYNSKVTFSLNYFQVKRSFA